jgi:hypothetical protein
MNIATTVMEMQMRCAEVLVSVALAWDAVDDTEKHLSPCND